MARKSGRAAAGSGTIRQRPDGLWEGRFTYIDDLGAKKRRSIYAPTQKECRQKLTAALRDVDTCGYKPPQRMTVGEWLDEWVNTYCVGLKPRTIDSYEAQIKNRIKPYIGTVQLAALTNTQVQRFYNLLQQGDDHHKPLSPKSIQNIHGILHKAMEQAIFVHLVRDNPCDHIKLPKVKKAQLKPLMDEDIARFLEAIKGDRFELLFMLDLFSGLRQSEILALQWDDIDFDNGLICVRRQLQRAYGGGGKYIFLDETKNGKSRIAAIAPSVVAVLRKQQRRQAEWQLAAGTMWDNPHNLVFTDELGGHLKHHTVYNHFKSIVRSIGMEDTRFHDLRHSYAIAALQNGDSPKDVQEQLGHYSSAFTMDTYAEVSDTMRKASQDRMERFIKQVSEL